MKETYNKLTDFINSLEDLQEQHEELIELHKTQDLKLSDYYHIIELHTLDKLDHNQLLKDMQETLKVRREVKTLLSVTGSALARMNIDEKNIKKWKQTLESERVYGYRVLEEEELNKYIKEY